MPNLIIVRHGQSLYNLQNRFTGSTDVELTDTGQMEARNAGRAIKQYPLDEAFTSVLVRAIHTLTIILQEIGNPSMPVTKTAALNERSYGDLQGLDKLEITKKFGAAQVQTWRRSYDVVPPNGESLKNTFDRVVPYYIKGIEPKLRAGKNIIIVAHGNSLRALMMHLEKISETKIADVELTTGVPRLYEFDLDLVLNKVSYLH